MSDSVRRTIPGGKQVTKLSAYADGWREAIAPLLSQTGWKIHSFGFDSAKLVSPDYKHTQEISRAFVEALQAVEKK